ncbi:SGNH/GDSL hydrolase family protein [Flagellimonas meridianipacifica]|uniref:Lysophospholipase L1-like esterase n=1 Tax=Flagellimonas meridianipacifica TaxID=1080225 RepID=A0A2T0MC80_9FLAO|nr:SGNH/GDSL hydrolase family protein [Allomuricauda pacifica]PRX55106.1 lysophospholipase L1-like esterase [Allomuricauda pacifica]
MNRVLILIAFSFFGLFPNKRTKAQDWPNLSRYQKENETLKLDSNNVNRIVFMGNSITEGWSTANPKFFDNESYINRGIGGQTTPQMLLRFRQDVISLEPAVVHILAGTNDIAENTGPISLEQIRDNILTMAQLAKANGIDPIVCSVLPAYDYPWRPGKNPNVKIPKLNAMLAKMAEQNNVTYLDYFSEMADSRNGLPEKYTTDEVHLTKEGYEVMENVFQKAIKEVLKKQ